MAAKLGRVRALSPPRQLTLPWRMPLLQLTPRIRRVSHVRRREQWRQEEPSSSESEEEGEGEGEGDEEGYDEGEEAGGEYVVDSRSRGAYGEMAWEEHQYQYGDGEEGDEAIEGRTPGDGGGGGGGGDGGGLDALLSLVDAASHARDGPAGAPKPPTGAPSRDAFLVRRGGYGCGKGSGRGAQRGGRAQTPSAYAPAAKPQPAISKAPVLPPTSKAKAPAAKPSTSTAYAGVGMGTYKGLGQDAAAAAKLVGIALDLATVNPQWIMLHVSQQASPELPRRRVKSLPYAWLGVHSIEAATEKIGDAERCCPIPKLSPGGQLCIRQSDLAGLRDGRYCLALYSRHRCVAQTLTLRFVRNRFVVDKADAARAADVENRRATATTATTAATAATAARSKSKGSPPAPKPPARKTTPPQVIQISDDDEQPEPERGMEPALGGEPAEAHAAEAHAAERPGGVQPSARAASSAGAGGEAAAAHGGETMEGGTREADRSGTPPSFLVAPKPSAKSSAKGSEGQPGGGEEEEGGYDGEDGDRSSGEGDDAMDDGMEDAVGSAGGADGEAAAGEAVEKQAKTNRSLAAGPPPTLGPGPINELDQAKYTVRREHDYGGRADASMFDTGAIRLGEAFGKSDGESDGEMVYGNDMEA